MLYSTNYDFHYDIQKQLLPRRNLRQACRFDISLYACTQKEGRGFDKAIEECKARMKRYNTKPNMLIIAPETALYVSTVPEQRIQFFEGGDRAVTEFREGVEGFMSTSFRGLGIFESNPFDNGDNAEALQMLRRNTQVGEWYRMRMPEVWNATHGLPTNGAAMAIMIFDEPADRLKLLAIEKEGPEMKFHKFFEKAYADKAAADKADPLGLKSLGKEMHTAGSYTVQKKVAFECPDEEMKSWARKTDKSIEASVNPDVSQAMKLAALTANDKNGLIAFLSDFDYLEAADWTKLFKLAGAGVWLPLDIVLTRPFIEHQMLSAVMAVSGRDTGAVLYGPSDMQLAANATVKVIEGHFTMHEKAVISKPQNVLVMRDIQAAGYVAGGDCTYFNIDDTTSDDDNAHTLGERLNFDHEDTNRYSSIIPIIKPYHVNLHEDGPFSITKMQVPWDTNRQGQPSHQTSFPGGKAWYDVWEKAWNTNQNILQGMDPEATAQKEFIRSGSYNNSFVFPGPYRSYSPFTTSMWELNVGQGHWGPDALPGDARWRRGESVSQDTARGAVQSMELALSSASRASLQRGHP